MTTIDLRNTVNEYIKNADVRLLKMIKALAETYQNEEPSLTEEHYRIVDKRKENHLQGKTKSYTWDEVKENAKKAL